MRHALDSDIGPTHGRSLATLAAILSTSHVTSIFTRFETFLYILANSQQYLFGSLSTKTVSDMLFYEI
jgi:hypothetical protein